MADYSGIGAFAGGAIQGYDASLSRYATIEDMRRRREAERRAAQQQALQSLISGATLASTHPDVAEVAIAQPDQEMFPAAPVQAGVQAARRNLRGAGMFTSGALADNIDMNDPDVAAYVARNPKEAIPMLQQMRAKKALRTSLGDPAITDAQRQQAYADFRLDAEGKAPEQAMIDRLAPTPVGNLKAVEAAGEIRGKGMPLPPGMDPSLGGAAQIAGATEGAQRRAASDVTLEPAPGRFGISRGHAQAQEQELGQTRGNIMGRTMGVPPGAAKPGATAEQFLAIEGETPFKRALVEAQVKNKTTEEPRRAAERIVQGVMAQGYYFDPVSGTVFGPRNIQGQAGMLNRGRVQVPTSINGVAVFNPRPIPSAMKDDASRRQFIIDQTKQWLGKRAIIGATAEGPIFTSEQGVTHDDIINFYKAQP